MLPTLSLGSWQIDTYALIVTLAVTASGVYAFERLLRLDYPPIVIARGLLLMSLGGAGLTLLANEIINRQRLAHSGFLAIQESRDIFWTLVGGGIVALLYIRWYKAPLGRVLDLGVPALPLAQAIARLGCAAAGCCYGRPTDSWLGINLPDDNGIWTMRYPTQLLAAAANLLIFLTLLAVEARFAGTNRVSERRPFDGFLALLYILLFSLKRFVLAYLRQEGTVPLLGSLSWMHLNALVAAGAAAGLIAWNFYRGRGEQVR
jgi:phosphatidylglycerol:prolipoprotein diacylglycerol transferase